LRQKIQILIISVLILTILLTPLNQANAIHKTKGLVTVDELQEGSFFIQIDAKRTDDLKDLNAVGIHAICKEIQKGKLVTLVPQERCVFEIESIRYIPSDGVGIFGKNIFFLFCIDSLQGNVPNKSVNNCFIPAQGEVSYGTGLSFGPNVEGVVVIGELANAGLELMGSLTLDIGFSIPLSSVQTKLAQGDYRLNRIGGNVLLDSGIGSIIAHEHIGWAHDPFTGTIEIFGKKPDDMKLVIGTVGLDNKVVCGGDGKTSCPDDTNSDKEFRRMLEYLCFSCPTTGGLPTSLSGPAELLQFNLPITPEEVAQLVTDNEAEILALMEKAISKTIGIEAVGAETETTTDDLFVVGDYLDALFAIDVTEFEDLIIMEFENTLADLDQIVTDVLASANPQLTRTDLSGNIEEIQVIIDTIEDVVNDVVDIADTVKTLKEVTLPICLEQDIPGISGLSCEMCTSGTTIQADCDGIVSKGLDGLAKAFCDLDTGKFDIIACPKFTVLEKAPADFGCYEICTDDTFKKLSDGICPLIPTGTLP